MCFFLKCFFSAQVIDKSGGQVDELFDVSKVEKFEISNEAYDKRTSKSFFTLLFKIKLN